LVARSQQMVRYDREIRASLSAWQQQALLDWIETILPQVSLCIFSDYAKGISSPDFMQAFIGLAERFQKPVLVDPKGNSLQKYRGAMLVTPNLLEVEQATGMVIHSDDDFLAAYRIMQVQVPGTNILIKLGARGMILFQPDGETFHAEAKARQVFDVTGAGDTVIATVAIALAAGASLHESIQLASLAAGIVVGKVGTASTTLVELSAHLKEIEGLWQQ
ncbi:MAG: bifunctional hydroxymethylpyrimidine kinase/phosphomethylpyrimidine kinase, partial [Bacteroidetes bacterium]|nr:bifunctional hydroxymethylpyrimidine kinase/phosphomethylpyrimidine kinase [Bacteroidota bacterium]